MLSRFWLACVLIVVSATTARAAELQTYQFVATEHRPFTRQCGECSFAVSANLVGEFDVLLDRNSDFAQLKRLDIRLSDAVNGYRPSTQLPEFDGIPLTEMWPIDLSMLRGHFISPHAVELAGPGPVHFVPWSQGGPKLEYDPQDFSQHLPDGVVLSRSSNQTALRIQSHLELPSASDKDVSSFGQTVTVEGIALRLFADDAGEYYIDRAIGVLVRSTEVPEPSRLVLGCLALFGVAGRFRW